MLDEIPAEDEKRMVAGKRITGEKGRVALWRNRDRKREERRQKKKKIHDGGCARRWSIMFLGNDPPVSLCSFLQYLLLLGLGLADRTNLLTLFLTHVVFSVKSDLSKLMVFWIQFTVFQPAIVLVFFLLFCFRNRGSISLPHPNSGARLIKTRTATRKREQPWPVITTQRRCYCSFVLASVVVQLQITCLPANP